VAGACAVLDDAVGLPLAPFPVDILDGWEHSPSDVLILFQHRLEGLVVVDGAIAVSGRDVTSQNTLHGAEVVLGEVPCRVS
jgi:hypothetical protein